MSAPKTDEFWRKCVFCGAPPDKKTKEHIIPLWLQKFAGGQDRKANVFTLDGDRNLPWKNLVLPACESCNGHYAKLEEIVKESFLSISEGRISARHISMLLNWMDKIRVGFWRLQLALGKSAHTIVPNFSINSRLGEADRLIRIFRYETEADGIGLVGTDTFSFALHPVAMTLFVRDIVILSVSTSGFLQKQMGITDRPQLIEANGAKLLISSKPDYSKFDPTWARSRFRYQMPRFFDMSHTTFDRSNGNMKPNKTPLFSDKDGSLSEVKADYVFDVPMIPKAFGSVKLVAALEVLEIQRDLMEIYDALKYNDEDQLQVSKANGQLNWLIQATADVYDASHPVPTFRRPNKR